MNRNAHGEIESPRPLRARDGCLELQGWLLDHNGEPPPLRLVVAGCTHEIRSGLPRPDLISALPDLPQAGRSGFAWSGLLPVGVHTLRLEYHTGGEWHLFRALTVSVKPPPFSAAIDTPMAQGVLRDRIKIGGWVEAAPLASLHLRFGHREVTCRVGLPRPEAPELPGFETKDFLPAGYGAVRIRAKLAGGGIRIVRTRLHIEIDRDENHAPELNLGAARIPLPRRAAHLPPPAEPVAHPQRILFVLPGSFAANHGLHVVALANELQTMGHHCTVAVALDPETVHYHADVRFTPTTHTEIAARADAFAAFDIIHAWTTSESTRRLVSGLRQPGRGRLVIHLEDNEPLILARELGCTESDLAHLLPSQLDPAISLRHTDPRQRGPFLDRADAITLITPRLAELAPPGKPMHLITPAADDRVFFRRAQPKEFRRALGLTDNTTVMFYHGNLHAANLGEVAELAQAVTALNADGLHTVLIRTGFDRVHLRDELATKLAPHLIHLGHLQHHRHLPELMALADIFVQPGGPDGFNNYRFPSKLPEFFAIGRPVVLPRTNLGVELRHGVDAYVVDRADADTIAEAVRELRRDRILYERLSEGAPAYARQHFSWRRSATALAGFYAELTMTRH